MIRLRPIRDEEFRPWLERLAVGYADDLERNGGLSAESAQAKARRDTERLFPGGRPSDANIVLVAEEEATGDAVGVLCFAEREGVDGPTAWVYDIEVDQAHRGRGLGRRAMELLEEEVRRRGLARIELNVMGGNEVARSLYRSLGYRETFVAMRKTLDG